MSKPLDPLIASRECPSGCTIFHERRNGKYGTFFFCNRCKHSISEAPRGGPDQPCGICEVCGGLLFWRTLADGTRFKACWSHEKHAAIFAKTSKK